MVGPSPEIRVFLSGTLSLALRVRETSDSRRSVVDNTWQRWRRWPTGQVLSAVDRRPSPVDYTHHAAWCTGRWAIGRDMCTSLRAVLLVSAVDDWPVRLLGFITARRYASAVYVLTSCDCLSDRPSQRRHFVTRKLCYRKDYRACDVPFY